MNRQTAAERQAEGIADVLRERDAYRDALAALVAAEDAYSACVRRVTEDDEDVDCAAEAAAHANALAAARKVVKG